MFFISRLLQFFISLWSFIVRTSKYFFKSKSSPSPTPPLRPDTQRPVISSPSPSLLSCSIMFPSVPLELYNLRRVDPAALRGEDIRGRPQNVDIDVFHTPPSDMPYRRPFSFSRGRNSKDLNPPPAPVLGHIAVFTDDDKNTPILNSHLPTGIPFTNPFEASYRTPPTLLGHNEDEGVPSLSWSSYPSPVTTNGPPTPNPSTELLGSRSVTGHSDDTSAEHERKGEFLSPMEALSPRCRYSKSLADVELDPSCIQRPSSPIPDDLDSDVDQNVEGDAPGKELGAHTRDETQLEMMDYVLEQERRAIMGMFKSGFDDDEELLEAQRKRLSIIYEDSAEEGSVKPRRKRRTDQEMVEQLKTNSTSPMPTILIPTRIPQPQLRENRPHHSYQEQQHRCSTISHSIYDPYFNSYTETDINDESYGVPTLNTTLTETETDLRTSPPGSGPTTPDSPLARPFIVYEPGTPTRGYFAGMKTLDLDHLPSTPSPAPPVDADVGDEEAAKIGYAESSYIRVSNSVLKLQEQVGVDRNGFVVEETFKAVGPSYSPPTTIPSITTTAPLLTDDFVNVMDVAVQLVDEEIAAAQEEFRSVYDPEEQNGNFEGMFFNKLLRRSGGDWKDVVMREARRSWGPQVTKNDVIIPAATGLSTPNPNYTWKEPTVLLTSSVSAGTIRRSSTWSNTTTTVASGPSLRKSHPTSYQDLFTSSRFACSPLSSIEKLDFFSSSPGWSLFSIDEASTTNSELSSSRRKDKRKRASREKGGKTKGGRDKENWGKSLKSGSTPRLSTRPQPSVKPLCDAKRNVVISHVPFKPSVGVIEHVLLSTEMVSEVVLASNPSLDTPCCTPSTSASLLATDETVQDLSSTTISQITVDGGRNSDVSSDTAVSQELEDNVRLVADLLSEKDNAKDADDKSRFRLSLFPSLNPAYGDVNAFDNDRDGSSSSSCYSSGQTQDSRSSSSHHSDEDEESPPLECNGRRKTLSLTLSLPFRNSISSRSIINLDIEPDSPAEPPVHHPFDLRNFGVAGTSTTRREEGALGRRSKAMDDILALLDEVCCQSAELITDDGCIGKKQLGSGTSSPVLEHFHAL
ncbi:hypothetical protein BDN72DRAFT_672721 [Pluteus cervinus]|uniref:Uncharacterized protein n=1 Tax=Pluteus cervinus TaxID=181527 RepID=A0ACD3B9B6_9AGAR|nr:hypothetical protein BDN72DRAFT_672721 [Pluteus cervinus]